MQSFTLYSNDMRDCYPMFAERRIADAFTNGGIALDYYAQSGHWPLAVRSYLGERALEQAWICPGGPTYRAVFRGYSPGFMSQYPPGYTHPSSYWMSFGAISDPKAWGRRGSPGDPTLLRAVRVHEVEAPASKGILLEAVAYHLGDGSDFDASLKIWEPAGSRHAFLIGFADGHVRAVPHRDLTPGWRSDEQTGYARSPVLATPDGVLGRDTN